jgi:hypothetical protein
VYKLYTTVIEVNNLLEINMNHQNVIQAMSDAIINARDFCGDEREAAIDAAHDMGVKPTRSMWLKACDLANGVWRQSQQKAGVKRKYWRY